MLCWVRPPRFSFQVLYFNDLLVTCSDTWKPFSWWSRLLTRMVSPSWAPLLDMRLHTKQLLNPTGGTNLEGKNIKCTIFYLILLSLILSLHLLSLQCWTNYRTGNPFLWFIAILWGWSGHSVRSSPFPWMAWKCRTTFQNDNWREQNIAWKSHSSCNCSYLVR